MSNPVTRITEFVLEQLAGQPLAKRIEIMRDLAAVAASPAEAKRFTAIADELAACERRHRQLVLDFKRESDRNGGAA